VLTEFLVALLLRGCLSLSAQRKNTGLFALRRSALLGVLPGFAKMNSAKTAVSIEVFNPSGATPKPKDACFGIFLQKPGNCS
jgi:hypothetical protein